MLTLEDMNRVILQFFRENEYKQWNYRVIGRHEARYQNPEWPETPPTAFLHFNEDFTDETGTKQRASIWFQSTFQVKTEHRRMDTTDALLLYLRELFPTGAFYAAETARRREVRAQYIRDSEKRYRVLTVECVTDDNILELIMHTAILLQQKKVSSDKYPTLKETLIACMNEKIRQCVEENIDGLILHLSTQQQH